MKDTDKPIIKVELTDNGTTATVSIKFPFAEQAYAFGEIVNTLLQKMPVVNNIPVI